MQGVERIAPLVGRILLALIFVMSGLAKLADWGTTAGYMASMGMPIVPLFLVGAVVLEFVGGLCIAVGFKAKIAAAALFFYLIPTSLIFHNFWTVEGMERQMQMVMFMKNLSIMGGLLLVAGFGPGPFSIDKRAKEG